MGDLLGGFNLGETKPGLCTESHEGFSAGLKGTQTGFGIRGLVYGRATLNAPDLVSSGIRSHCIVWVRNDGLLNKSGGDGH